jgi:DNA replication protein DnaC
LVLAVLLRKLLATPSPGTGKTLAIALGIRACLAGHRVLFPSNKPLSAWGEIFGDEVTATAMIDRLVHHADILSLKSDSYRLKDRDRARPPTTRTTETA